MVRVKRLCEPLNGLQSEIRAERGGIEPRPCEGSLRERIKPVRRPGRGPRSVLGVVRICLLDIGGNSRCFANLAISLKARRITRTIGSVCPNKTQKGDFECFHHWNPIK
jgi:hypothetical protein